MTSNANATASMADLHRWQDPPVWRMLSTGTHFSGRHHNTTWRALAQVHGNHEPGLPMVVKWMHKKETLAAELACALAGQALRLQVPGGVLVLAEKDQLPGLPRKVAGAANDWVLCFGSEYQFPDDTAVRPSNEDAVEEWIWQRLCDTKQGPAGGVWDELIANNDRHCDNVVFDGTRWWLIDHEDTLSPVAKVMKKFTEQLARQSVLDYHPTENTLASQVAKRRPQDHGMHDLPAGLSRLKLRLSWLADLSQNWCTHIPEVDTVLMMTHLYLRSIELRLPALALHLSRRLAQPEGDSLWNSSNAYSPPKARSAMLRRPA